MPEDTGENRIPIVEERARIQKQTVLTGLVRITSQVEESLELLRDELIAQTVAIERVVVNREVETPPGIRSDGDVLIIPVIEQRLVVEKRWIVTEELHVRKREHTESVEIPVALRSTRVSVERAQAAEQSGAASD